VEVRVRVMERSKIAKELTTASIANIIKAE
jgi:hypothetical protein